MQDNLVFWYKDTYRGVFIASTNSVHPYIPLSVVGLDGRPYQIQQYPSKELMFQEQPHLANYTQIDLEVDIPWGQFFGIDKA